MVDELSIGLADLGQDVYVISPYYERNRKGQTGYLAQDPAGIHYKDNIHVGIGGGFTLGVHEGKVKGVTVVFLHNGDIFPSPYPEAQPSYIVQQIAVFDKACLEYCCQRGIIPSICVTNDWFTGLVAGYAKIGHFGDTFKGTCFLHICHNLQELYEGKSIWIMVRAIFANSINFLEIGSSTPILLRLSIQVDLLSCSPINGLPLVNPTEMIS